MKLKYQGGSSDEEALLCFLLRQKEAMMKDTLRKILWMIGIIGYLWSIWSIGQISLGSPNQIKVEENGVVKLDDDGEPVMRVAPQAEISEPYLTVYTLMGTALAVHTGIFVNETDRRRLFVRKKKSEGSSNEEGSTFWEDVKLFFSTLWGGLTEGNIPIIAVTVYILGLLWSFYFYYRDGFSSASAEILRSSASTLFGLIAGLFGSGDN